MRIQLHHSTHYEYDRPVQLGPQRVRLHPARHGKTRILSYALRVEPASHYIHWHQDALGNQVARLAFTEPTAQFHVNVDMLVDLQWGNPFDFFLEPAAAQFPFMYSAADQRALAPFLACDRVGDGASLMQVYLLNVGAQDRPTLEFLVALNQQVQRDIHYRVRLEPGVQTPLETLQSASGSCRDSAWLLIRLLRHAGLAARFVSGYLLDLDPSLPAVANAPTLDTTHLHAWAEVYLPGAGWIGLDATSGLLTGLGHIPLACGITPEDAAPVDGMLEPAQVNLYHRIDLTVLPD